MFSKSRLVSAKQKISKLQEKYSKSGVLSDEPSNSISLSLFDSTNVITRKNELEEEENVQGAIQKQTKKHKHDKVVGIVKPVIPGHSEQEDDIKFNEFRKSSSTLNAKFTSNLSNKVTPEILVLSDLSNQMEHICLVSSSSDELSVVPSEDLFSSENSLKDSKSAEDKIESPTIYFKSVETLANQVEKTEYETEHSDKYLTESIIDSVSESIISSVEELSSMLDADYADRSESSVSDHKSETVTSGCIQLESRHSTPLHSAQYKKTAIDVPLNSALETGGLMRSQETTGNAVYSSPIQSSNGDSSISKQISGVPMSIYNQQHLSDSNSNRPLKKEANGRKSSCCSVKKIKSSSKGLYHNKSILTCQKKVLHNTCLKPATRPFLKSCRLIRYNETSNKCKGASFISKHKILDSALVYDKKTDYYCDEVIKQLAKNQIEMTRHFIESHHQMYLHCCRAVKVMSENYLKQQ